MIYERFKAMLLHDRTAPVITTLMAMVAFALSLVALLSTSKDGLSQYNIVMLNTSTLFQNVIKVDTAGASMTARGLEVIQTPVPTPPPDLLEDRQFSLPSPSQVASFFGSAASGVASALTPKSTSPANPANPANPTAGGGTGNLLNDIQSFFGMLLGDGAAIGGNEIDQVINTLVKDVVDVLNIQDWYSIYMTGFCDGHYTTSNGLNTTACISYQNINIPAPNSTLTLGTTTLDFSALNIPQKLSNGATQIKAILTAILALQIIGIVSSGLLIVLAPLSLIISFLNRRFVHASIAALTSLAAACFAIIALIATGIAIIVSAVVNGLADGLGVEAYSGSAFLGLMWVSAVFMGVAGLVWFARWHAHTFTRRIMEVEEMQRPMAKTAESAFIQR